MTAMKSSLRAAHYHSGSMLQRVIVPAAFSLSLPRRCPWSLTRDLPDSTNLGTGLWGVFGSFKSHGPAASFPPSGFWRVVALALTPTAIVVQWTSLNLSRTPSPG
jgi:hypothetical protein